MGYQIAHVHSTSNEVLPKVKSKDEGKILGIKDGKWAAVESEAADLAQVAKTGEYSDLNNAPDLSVYADKAETEQAIQNVLDAIGDIAQFKTAVVDELPAEGEAATIYFLRNGDEEGNACKEYIFIDGSWELIGDTSIDLSPYVTWNSIGAAAQSNDYEDLDNLPVIPSVPIALSEFVNDAGFITENDLPDIPSNVSELNNDAGYITENDLPNIPENVSAFNNDAGYLSDVPVESLLSSGASTGGYRLVTVANVNRQGIVFPGHVMVECGPAKDDLSDVEYAYNIANLTSYAGDTGVQSNYKIPVYFDEITHPKQVVTKEYVDNAIANAPAAEVSYSEVKNAPTKVSQFDNDADYIPREQYNKLLKALDTLVADQGKGARSAEGELFETAMDAIDAAEPGVPMEVALTADEDDGAAFLLMNAGGDVDKDITFDLNGHDYLATQAGGSAGTQTQAVHLEKGNTVVIKGGTLEAALSNPSIKMLIQNYSNLTLEDMVIDCSDNNNVLYCVSNNFGHCVIKNCTITPASGRVAVDCWFGLANNGDYDDGVIVEIIDSTINGNIEYGAQPASLSRPGNEEWWEKAQLIINNSIVNGQIVNSGAGANDQHHIVIDGVRYEGELPIQFNLM